MNNTKRSVGFLNLASFIRLLLPRSRTTAASQEGTAQNDTSDLIIYAWKHNDALRLPIAEESDLGKDQGREPQDWQTRENACHERVKNRRQNVRGFTSCSSGLPSPARCAGHRRRARLWLRHCL
jgi:hypothetical protein